MSPLIDAVVRVLRGLRTVVGYIRNSEDDMRVVYGDHPKGSAAAQQSALHGAVSTSIANNGAG